LCPSLASRVEFFFGQPCEQAQERLAHRLRRVEVIGNKPPACPGDARGGLYRVEQRAGEPRELPDDHVRLALLDSANELAKLALFDLLAA
jgi:hypothetical protein